MASGRNDLSDLLKITGSILPGITRSRERAADQVQQQALNKANENKNEYTRNVVLNQNDIFRESFEDQSQVKESRDPFVQRVEELRNKREMDGTRTFTDSQIAQDEAVIGKYTKWNQALGQADPQNKRQIEMAILQQKDDDLLRGVLTAEEINELSDAALNRLQKSKNIGVADENAIITKDNMIKKYGKNFTAKQAVDEVIIQQEARALGVSLDEMTNANLKTRDLSKLRNLGFEQVRIDTITAHSSGESTTTLKGPQLDSVFQKLDELQINMIGHLDGSIARDTKRGGGLVDESTYKRVVQEIRDSVQGEKDFYSSHSDISQLRAANEMALLATKNGAGDSFDHVRKLITLAGQKGQDAYVGFMTQDGKMKEIARNTLTDLLPGVDVDNIPSVWANIATGIGNRNPDPKTAKITVPLSVQIASGESTDVDESVVQHAVNGIKFMTKTTNDISNAVDLYVKQGFVNKINEGGATTKRDFVTAHNSNMKSILNDIKSENYTIEYLPDQDRMEVSRIEKKRRTNADIMNGVPKDTTIKVMNKTAMKAINSVYSKMIKPGLYPGLLPDENKFYEDLAVSSGDLGVTFIHPTYSPSTPELLEANSVRSRPDGPSPAQQLLSKGSEAANYVNDLIEDPSTRQALLDLISAKASDLTKDPDQEPLTRAESERRQAAKRTSDRQ